MSRVKCLILGASGLVGQRLQQRLFSHPMFEIGAVAGSLSTAGKSLRSIPWRLSEPRPDLPELEILNANSEELVNHCHELDISIAFSGLPSKSAMTIEKHLTDSGITVFSNASAYRRTVGIPMVIPEINAHHLHSSMHYCATNCTLIPLAIPVSIIDSMTNIKSITMRSEQALSGAGWELLYDEAALSGDVNPEIDGEAEKTRAELLYVLGTVESLDITPLELDVSVVCQRISRPDGHQVFVEIETSDMLTHDELIDAMQSAICFNHLPSGPNNTIHLVEEIEPLTHLWSDGTEFSVNPDPATNLKAGMAIVLGNISVNEHKISFSAYSHNTIRGAAGGLVYLAELVLSESLT
mgnify:FL=1